MAEWRAIQRSVCTDPRHAMLSEYGQVLAMRLPLHCDDYGAFQADPMRVKLLCTPASQRSVADVEAALLEMVVVELIGLYRAPDGKLWGEVLGWEGDQPRELIRKRGARRSPQPIEFIDVAESADVFRKVPEGAGKVPPRLRVDSDLDQDSDPLPTVEGDARGFALAPPPVEPEKRKAKKAKEPPKPPEPVVVPEHMQPLVDYQQAAMQRPTGKAKQTVDAVVRWAIGKEEYLGFMVDWRRLVHRFDEWQHTNQTYRPNTTGALATWFSNSEARGNIREWEIGSAPQQPQRPNGNGYVPPRANPNVRAYNPVMTDNCIVSTPESAARWLAGEAERKARGEDF